MKKIHKQAFDKIERCLKKEESEKQIKVYSFLFQIVIRPFYNYHNITFSFSLNGKFQCFTV